VSDRRLLEENWTRRASPAGLIPPTSAGKILDCREGNHGVHDLREWLAVFDKEGELRRITAEVDWDRELGAIARRTLEKKGPALLSRRSRAIGEAAARSSSRCAREPRTPALTLGFPKDARTRSFVQYVMQKKASASRRDGPHRTVKECIVVRGHDQTEFRFALALQGGRRYITRSPGSSRATLTPVVMNVGIYRGMIGQRDTTPMLLIKGGQHWDSISSSTRSA